MRDRRIAFVAAMMAGVSPSLASQTDSTARLPGAYVERDTAAMVSRERLVALPAAERAAWQAYIARSRALQARDRALLRGELESTRAPMTRAPYLRESFVITPAMTDEFFRSDSAQPS